MGERKLLLFVVKVYEIMRYRGLFLDFDIVFLILKVYGDLDLLFKVESVYKELIEIGLVFREEVYLKMLELYGYFRELELVKFLFMKLKDEWVVFEKIFCLFLVCVYENNNRLDDVLKII